jgi:hypothetical protein
VASTPSLFLLQVRRIEDHEPRQLECGGGCNHFAAEAALGKQRQATAMVEMCVGEEYIVDRGGIEAEGLRIFFTQRPSTLEQATIDQDAPAKTLDQMA